MNGRQPKKPHADRKAPRCYWDTCVFLAWIKDEECWSDSITQGIAQTIEMAISRQVVIVTSALTITEALASKLTKEQNMKFAKIFSVPYVQLIDLDRRVSGKAAAI